jgi:hypothetical protein
VTLTVSICLFRDPMTVVAAWMTVSRLHLPGPSMASLIREQIDRLPAMETDRSKGGWADGGRAQGGAQTGNLTRAATERKRQLVDPPEVVLQLGLLGVLEFCQHKRGNNSSGEPGVHFLTLVGKLMDFVLSHGVLTVPCGRYGNVLRVMPSLTIPRSLMFKALDLFGKGLATLGQTAACLAVASPAHDGASV